MPGHLGGRDLGTLGTLCLVAVGIPLWLSGAAGAIGIPSNDDWVYMRSAEILFHTASIEMPGHTAASIGQLVMVQPILWLSGGDPWAFTAFGLVMALIGIASTYLLARRFVGTGAALMVSLMVLVFPGFARETASFMTDVPTYALVTLSLLLGARWLQGDGTRGTLVASLLAGLAAVSIREFALAAPAAILVAAWARSRPDERVWLAGASGAFAAGTVGVLMIASSVPGHAGPATPSLQQVGLVGSAFATLAAILLPAAALAIGRRIATLSPSQIILGSAVGCLIVALPSGPAGACSG